MQVTTLLGKVEETEKSRVSKDEVAAKSKEAEEQRNLVAQLKEVSACSSVPSPIQSHESDLQSPYANI